MIYIDPPYNTGSDFIYNDDFKMSSDEYANKSGEVDEVGNRMFKNTDSNGRFHSDWCSMIYPRLLLARNLLSDDGVIFISIDDNEQANLKKICDEVFGTENFIASFPRITKKGGKSSDVIAKNHDYIIMYSKTDTPILYAIGHNDDAFKYKDEYFDTRGYYKLNQTLDYDSLQYSKNLDYPLEIDNEIFYPGNSKESYKKRQSGIYNTADWAWRWSKKKFDFGYSNGFIVIKKSKNGKRIYTKTYQKAKIEEYGNNYCIEYSERTKSISTLETTLNKYSNDNATKDIDKIIGKKFFDHTKPESLISLLSNLCTNNNDIILDFFSGSASTAHAVMQLNAQDGGNRKFIMVQLPELCDKTSEAYKAGYKNICEIGKERIRRAGKKIFEENKDKEGIENLDIGFRVLKLDDTNMRDIYYSPSEYSQDLLFKLDSNVKSDRSDLDLLFGCLLEWGLSLSLPYTCENIEGCAIHNYNDGDLIACFDENISENAVIQIAKQRPLRAVFRDTSFANSPSKINIKEIFKLLSPNTRVKVI